MFRDTLVGYKNTKHKKLKIFDVLKLRKYLNQKLPLGKCKDKL